MPIDADLLEQLLKTGVPDCEVEIQDLRGDGDHYAAHVISPAFIGKTRVVQHKMVFDALQGKMKDELHALSIRTSVPRN